MLAARRRARSSQSSQVPGGAEGQAAQPYRPLRMRARRRRASAVSRIWIICASSSGESWPASRSWARRRASSADSSLISSARSATSARTVTRSGSTSRNPPPTKSSVSSDPFRISINPGRSVVSSGACRGRMPSSPSAPRQTRKGLPCPSTSPSKSELSTLTTRSDTATRLLILRLHLLALLAGFVDRADHVERLLRQVVVLALQDLLEAPDGVLDGDEPALPAREALRDEEGLREEPLDLPGPRHRLLVVFRKLLDAQDGDDVLQLLVALHGPLHALRRVVMILPDDPRFEEAGGRVQGVDRRVDRLLGQGPAQRHCCPQMGEGRLDGGVGHVVGRDVDRLDRGDGALAGGGDALLQGAHRRRQRRLVADRGRHPAQKGRHL